MQDAFVRDMFSLSDVNNSRYNGHVQISSCGKSTGGKRDRKGCTKGKIEAIMKNNSVRPKVCISASVKKQITSINNHNSFSNHSVKVEQEEDPYTFTEPEPQALSLYQPSGSSNKKPAPLRPSPTTMVCQEKNKVEHGKTLLKVVKTSEGTSKMNKLQADIARNKVIGKRRKIVDQSSPKVNEWAIKREPGKVCISAKRKSIWQRERNSKHELLERIDQVQNNLNQFTRDLYPLGLEVSDSDSDSEQGMAVYERSWFCSSGEGLPRERRVELARASLRRRLHHTVHALRLTELPPRDLYTAIIAAARRFPSATAAILDPTLSLKAHLPINRKSMFLLKGEKCSYPEGCEGQALPCTRHCVRHIMYNVDQHLFSHCTAKYPDNTQCTTPVFDVLHHLPLCHRHASTATHETQNRLSDSRSAKKVSKKSRILGSSKRNNKKRKKLGISPTTRRQSSEVTPAASPAPPPLSQGVLETATNAIVPQPHDTGVVEEVPVEEVLAIASLDPAELASQATRLLEEHDLTNVLNQLSTDAFNDIFIDKNGEYEPTREETEELERALEAVNNDVRSLETLSRSLPLLQLPLDTMALLDDPTPFTSFHNGFPPPQTHQS